MCRGCLCHLHHARDPDAEQGSSSASGSDSGRGQWGSVGRGGVGVGVDVGVGDRTRGGRAFALRGRFARRAELDPKMQKETTVAFLRKSKNALQRTSINQEIYKTGPFYTKHE
ncbi:BQ5605_C042g12040 [Microbotryum silenes-dioicae]|uniref:BQ5605_C042g12040 protein n=1 Tax=Microbotryum silenes-dioicae TaxID=796604 RepID=A0A2X0MTH7_9BASI|nr:BQ5605_C042g12040 [Microbotryum silenes-dioicae]